MIPRPFPAARAVLLAAALTLFAATMAAFAQEAGREVVVTQDRGGVSLIGMWKTGGWSMYPIAALSIAAAALTIFGFLNGQERKMVRMELYAPLVNAIRALDFQTASTLCTGTPSVMTNILNAGLQRLDPDTVSMTSVDKAMEEAAVEENTIGMRPINYLSVIASIAPMMGLLGTVSGMIKAFQKIGLGGMGDPEKLANDIGEAMITTAFGLIVGIPAMFFYFFLKAKFGGNMARIGRVLGNLTHEMKQAFDRAHERGDLSGYLAPVPLGEAAAPEAQSEG